MGAGSHRRLGLDERIYHARPQLTLLLVAVVSGLALATLFTLLGWRWPSGWLRPIDLGEEVEALLAVGTLSLAYAAFLQAYSAEKARQDNLSPLLDLQVTAPTSPKETPAALGPEAVWLQVSDTTELNFRVRNLGPGNAMRVNVRALVWLNTNAPECWDEPTLDPIGTVFNFGAEPVSERSLAGNEDHSFPVQVAVKMPAPNESTRARVLLTRRILLQATGVNLEGKPVDPAYCGVQLTLAQPTMQSRRLSIPGQPRRVPDCYITLWNRMRSDEVRRMWVNEPFNSVAFGTSSSAPPPQKHTST